MEKLEKNKLLFVPFLGLLYLVADEYIGIGNHYIRLLKALPIPLAVCFLCFLYVFFKVGPKLVFQNPQVKCYFLFTFMTFCALLYGFIQSYALDPLKQQIGYFMLMIIAIFSINSIKRLYIFCLSFVFFLNVVVIINLNKFFESSRIGGYKSGYFAGDGNDFGWMMNVGFPLSLFLVVSAKKKLHKIVALGMSSLVLLGVLGTQSRGAFLALSCGIIYFLVMVSKNKIRNFIVMGIVALGVFIALPGSYTSRMGTIGDYEEDTSAMGRVKAWRAALEMAVNNPILGVGADSFNSAYGRLYRRSSDPVRWISTHSVYFKIVAEYGFTGLILYLMIIWKNYKQNRYVAKQMSSNPEAYKLHPQWPDFLNMSLVAFFVASSFLSGVNYPHLYILTALTISTTILFNDSSNKVNDESEKVDSKPKKVNKFY